MKGTNLAWYIFTCVYTHTCVNTIQVSPQHASCCSLPADGLSKVSMILMSIKLDWFYLFMDVIEMKSYGIDYLSWASLAYHYICEIRHCMHQ